MKFKRHWMELSLAWIVFIVSILFAYLIWNNSTFREFIIIYLVICGSTILYLLIFLFIYPGLFTDTIEIDEEKIVFDTKKYKKVIYWGHGEQILCSAASGGTKYYILELGATRKDACELSFTFPTIKMNIQFKKAHHIISINDKESRFYQ